MPRGLNERSGERDSRHDSDEGDQGAWPRAQGVEYGAVGTWHMAAGERDVQIVGGASTVQQALNAGLCDELHIDIMPVLFGEGLRIFENIELDKFELARSKVEETTRTRMGIVLRVIYHKQPVS